MEELGKIKIYSIILTIFAKELILCEKVQNYMEII